MGRQDNNNLESLDFYKRLALSLPEVFARNAIDDLTGGVFKGRYMANLMSKGEGPTGRRIGNKVLIFRDDFISWLRLRYDQAA
jgi:hypothetical protein